MSELFSGNDIIDGLCIAPIFFQAMPNNTVMPNIPTAVLDKGEFWTTLKEESGLKLQQNKITGHARVINSKKIRLAWGNVEAMRKVFKNFKKPWAKCKKGDILAVRRLGGLYSHYAVYAGKGKVIHYAAKNGDIGKGECIQKADFSDFLGDEISFEILSFYEDGDRPKHRTVNLVEEIPLIPEFPIFRSRSEYQKYIRKLKGYHIYTPEETVDRAESRLGETKYNLAFNNCEHFAIWCKTGVHESTQIEDLLLNFFNPMWYRMNPIMA